MPAVIGVLSALKAGGECWSRKDWRRERNWDPTFSTWDSRLPPAIGSDLSKPPPFATKPPAKRSAQGDSGKLHHHTLHQQVTGAAKRVYDEPSDRLADLDSDGAVRRRLSTRR